MRLCRAFAVLLLSGSYDTLATTRTQHALVQGMTSDGKETSTSQSLTSPPHPVHAPYVQPRELPFVRKDVITGTNSPDAPYVEHDLHELYCRVEGPAAARAFLRSMRRVSMRTW
jgi:hypothetical protein